MANDSSAIILLFMMSVMSSIISVILGGGWYLTRPIEGDECEGEDKDGVYIIDEDGKCVLDYCNPGYVKSGQKCMYDDTVEDETGYMPPGSVTDEAEGSGEDISQTPSSTMDTCSGECPGGLTSANGMYNFIMQEDGNLVLYEGSTVHWSSNTGGVGVAPYRLVMQGDGNLVIYDVNDTANWASNTNGVGTGPYRLVMQNDRNVVIYDSTNAATWATDTYITDSEAPAAPSAPGAPAARTYSIRGYNTNTGEDGGGNAIYLDRQHVNCGDDALNRFQLTRPGENTINYRVHCLEGVNSGSTDWTGTEANEDGGGNAIYLDRHHINCGMKPISEFWLRRPTDNQINYAYKCSNLSHTNECRVLYTPFDDDGGGNAIYLDRHNVQCGEGEAMTEFVLQRNSEGNKIRYGYRCCKMP